MNEPLGGKPKKITIRYVEKEKKSSKKTRQNYPKNRPEDKKTPLTTSSSPYVSWQDKKTKLGDGQRSTSSLVEREQSRLEPLVSKEPISAEQIRKQRAEEIRVYGENACQMLFKYRADAIVKAWFVQSVTPRFSKTLSWLANQHKVYRVVDEDELTKVSGTEHHEGVCFLIKKRQAMTVVDYLSAADPIQDCVLALDGVANPYNLGAIMRSCAHFGVQAILTEVSIALESGASLRIAEGGMEFIKPLGTENFTEALQQFRTAGYAIATTSSHKGTLLTQTRLPAKMVLVLGREKTGLAEDIWQTGDLQVRIGGTTQVESLNVSVAVGVLLSEWWRQNRATG